MQLQMRVNSSSKDALLIVHQFSTEEERAAFLAGKETEKLVAWDGLEVRQRPLMAIAFNPRVLPGIGSSQS